MLIFIVCHPIASTPVAFIRHHKVNDKGTPEAVVPCLRVISITGYLSIISRSDIVPRKTEEIAGIFIHHEITIIGDNFVLGIAIRTSRG